MKEFKCNACKDARVLLKAEPIMVRHILQDLLTLMTHLSSKHLMLLNRCVGSNICSPLQKDKCQRMMDERNLKLLSQILKRSLSFLFWRRRIAGCGVELEMLRSYCLLDWMLRTGLSCHVNSKCQSTTLHAFRILRINQVLQVTRQRCWRAAYWLDY